MYDREPNRADIEGVDAWEGWSIRTFWANVQTNAVTRISFSPAEPVFDGPVYVLTSRRTASAAELAIDALRVAQESDVAVLLKDLGGGRIKGSMRSRGRVDVGAIAESLGGGGHHNAAGFTATSSVDQVMAAIRDRLEAFDA